MHTGSASAWIALRTYLVPLTTTRAFRLGLLLFFGIIGITGFLLSLGLVASRLASSLLASLGDFLVIPGLPIAAILVSELPLRDGIRQRTLLYPLLGPASRVTLAVVRTLATAILLAAGTGFLLALVHLAGGGHRSGLALELLASAGGAVAYTGLFGFVHLVSHRGLITGLVLFVLVDEPLGRVPFSIRNLSPSYHVRLITDRLVDIPLPVPIDFPQPTSIVPSAMVLAALGIAFAAATALIFKRKNLGELC
jgi:ABC-2 type transport system permease protein